MKKIKITISLHTFRRVIKMPCELDLPNDSNIIDILSKLDEKYHMLVKDDNKSHIMDFQDKKVKSLLQMLWDPWEERFYNDVGIEARKPFPELKALPIEKNWAFNIPSDATLILTPDPMC